MYHVFKAKVAAKREGSLQQSYSIDETDIMHELKNTETEAK